MTILILNDNIFEKLTFNKLLQNAYEKAKLKSKGYEKKTIEIILGGMNLVSKEMIFSHDLIREFFSFKYWKKLLGERETEEVKEMKKRITTLIKELQQVFLTTYYKTQ